MTKKAGIINPPSRNTFNSLCPINSFPNQSIKDTAEYLEFLVGDKKGKEQ